MVKRIRKRVPKKEDATTDSPEAPEEEEEVGLKADLAALGEDEFTKKTASFFQWIIDHRFLVGGVAAAVVIAIVATYVVQKQKAEAVAEASASFNDAADRYGKAIGEGPSPVPGVQAVPVVDPAKQRAQLTKAKEAFESTRRTYGDRGIKHLATLGLASTHLDLGAHAEALTQYDAFLAESPDEPFAKVIALQAKAAALEEQGKAAEAIDAWKALAATDPKAFGLMAGMQVGRILEAQGKAAEARTEYQRLKKDHGAALDEMANRVTRSELERRLAILGESS